MKIFPFILLWSIYHFKQTKAKGYDHKTANTWPKHFPLCGGTRQSPINIEHKDTIFRYYGKVIFNSSTSDNLDDVEHFSISNKGHTVQVDFPLGAINLTMDNKDVCFSVVQMHWHWGSDDTKGSEHQHNSRQFPLEGHIVTFNCRLYSTVSEAVAGPGGLAVFGVFYEISGDGKKSNTPFDNIVEFLKTVRESHSSNNGLPAFDIVELFPPNPHHFYRYDGSLTTPPCSENVLWTVFRNRVAVSVDQMEEFRKLIGNHDVAIGNNFRPVSIVDSRRFDGSGRIVYRSFSSGDVTRGHPLSGPCLKLMVLTNFCISLLFIGLTSYCVLKMKQKAAKAALIFSDNVLFEDISKLSKKQTEDTTFTRSYRNPTTQNSENWIENLSSSDFHPHVPPPLKIDKFEMSNEIKYSKETQDDYKPFTGNPLIPNRSDDDGKAGPFRRRDSSVSYQSFTQGERQHSNSYPNKQKTGPLAKNKLLEHKVFIPLTGSSNPNIQPAEGLLTDKKTAFNKNNDTPVKLNATTKSKPAEKKSPRRNINPDDPLSDKNEHPMKSLPNTKVKTTQQRRPSFQTKHETSVPPAENGRANHRASLIKTSQSPTPPQSPPEQQPSLINSQENHLIPSPQDTPVKKGSPSPNISPGTAHPRRQSISSPAKEKSPAINQRRLSTASNASFTQRRSYIAPQPNKPNTSPAVVNPGFQKSTIGGGRRDSVNSLRKPPVASNRRGSLTGKNISPAQSPAASPVPESLGVTEELPHLEQSHVQPTEIEDDAKEAMP